MQAPWTLGRVLALVTLILAVVLLFLCLLLPGAAAHLSLWLLVLLAALALAVVIS